MSNEKVLFNIPYISGKELKYIENAHRKGRLAGDGAYTQQCEGWLRQNTGTHKALLTHSCTAALEMAALLLNIKPGDEIIMPSFTFVSTANAFVLRGGVPVFVDIRDDTLNIDEKAIESAITPNTRAVVVVHYAGVACEMDLILQIASKHSLAVIEDAAQGIMSSYKGRPLGSMGEIGALSFHETKNIISGEGGAILINDSSFADEAEIIREKGTNRSKHARGEIDKYSWQNKGSSFLPGEITAAFLFAQLEVAEDITQNRLESWGYYHELLGPLEAEGLLRRPVVPEVCGHNGHIYHIRLAPWLSRNEVIEFLGAQDINTVFHYVPLHSSPGGLRFGRTEGAMSVTNTAAEALLRLPLWYGINRSQQDRVAKALKQALQA